ncbi:MAG: DUF559 domain-containing protein [Acidimicrobiia bacterium]|nr:DUF559 domain-containing protein [Acidimicrobiia bacterium]
MAAVLATGEDAVASHGSAARLWRLDCPHDDQLEVTSPRTRRVRIPGVRAHRSVVFLGEEHGRTRGIAATSVARTIVDLSGRLSTRELGVVLDDGLRRNIVTLDVLRRCVAGLAPAPGRRPSRVHRLLVDRLPGYDPGESELEMRVVRTLVAGGVPQPVLQHEVAVADRSYRLDLAYPGSRLAIEVDGWEFHRSRAAFDRDRTRANALVVAGWTLLRFTSRMSPEEMVVSVKTALAALGHERTS